MKFLTGKFNSSASSHPVACGGGLGGGKQTETDKFTAWEEQRPRKNWANELFSKGVTDETSFSLPSKLFSPSDPSMLSDAINLGKKV